MDVAAQDHQTLRRIVALLVALAVLAERAGSRSLPVRFLVLSLLRRAEPVAWAFVFGATQTRRREAPLEGQSPAAAERLARRFGALAAALGALLRRACRFDASGRAPRRPTRRREMLLMSQGGFSPRPADTS